MAKKVKHDTYGTGVQAIGEWIETLRSAGSLVENSAEEVAALVKESLTKTAKAQTDPYGMEWPAGKEGKPVLNNASSQITTEADGNVVWVGLEGHYVYHHFGAGHDPKRRLVPADGMPDRLGNAIRLGIVKMSEEFLTRKGRKKFNRQKAGIR